MPLKPAIYEQLKKIRTSTTLSLKPTPMLRAEIVDRITGTTSPLKIRYYQSQGIYHMLVMARMVLGDGTGIGKTLQAIGALCYQWEKEPDNKVLVVCPKSAIRQWESEVYRFTHGIKVYVATGSPDTRKAVYEAWAAAPTGPGDLKSILVTNYHSVVGDWDKGARLATKVKAEKSIPVPGLLDGITKNLKLTVIYDECTAFKNSTTKTWQTCKIVSERAKRVYGLTATLLRNNLIEGFSIYKVIQPDVFTTKTAFMDKYCVTQLQRISGGRKIPIVVGYKNLAEFRATIDPFFLGRAKHMVSSELPTLTTREVTCDLSPAEAAKYGEALDGLLELGDGEIKDFEETKALTSLIYCQEIVDSLALLKFKGGEEVIISLYDDERTSVKDLSSKETTLLDLLSNDFDGEKVIIYTRFARMAVRLLEIFKSNGITAVKITGAEDSKKRQTNQDAFQRLDSGINVIIITDAGSEAINLQAAQGMIFVDSPWSWGGYVQLLGRMIRIGSPHPTVLAVHLVAKLPGDTKKGRQTIDDHVLKSLRAKKGLIDQIIGEAAQGALTFDRSGSDIRQLFNAVVRDALDTGVAGMT